MYKEDIKIIKLCYMHQPGDTLESVVRFVLATIQQHFNTVPNVLDQWAEHGLKSPTMWGMKTKGVKYIAKHKHDIAAALTDTDVVDAIDTLLQIPGLNTVKAAFTAQLLGFEVGCIDSHNARIHGVNVQSFAITGKLKARTRLAKISAYVELCRGLGGSEVLWDQWCHLIADRQHSQCEDAEAVSRLHSLMITHHVDQNPTRW